MAGNYIEKGERFRLGQNPLALLLVTGVAERMAGANPLMETGSGRGMKKITPGNWFDIETRFGGWLDVSGRVMRQYSDNELSRMWTAFCGGGLTTEYGLDMALANKGMLKRTVDGYAYKLLQFGPSIELGKGWRMADVMVSPTGEVDAARISFPDVIRGLSPPIFFRENMPKDEQSRLQNLFDEFTRTMLNMYKVASVDKKGEWGYLPGLRPGSRITLDNLLAKPAMVSPVRRDDPSGIGYGKKVRTSWDLMMEMYEKARGVMVKGVNKVGRLAGEVARGFVDDYSRVSAGQIDKKRLELAAMAMVSPWPGNLLRYFDKHFNDPVVKWGKLNTYRTLTADKTVNEVARWDPYDTYREI